MVPNRISNELSEESRDEILRSIDYASRLMPFLTGLDPRERQMMLKAGDRCVAFIRKAAEVGQMNPGYLPRAFNLEEMRKDMALMDALYPIMVATSQLAEKLADTYAIASSEAYASALLVYRSIKSVKGESGLEQAYAELRRQFARRQARTESATDEGQE